MKEPLAALVERCRRREEDAIAELVSRFRNWALDLANALLDDASLAEDAVQEAFTTALLRLNDLWDPLAFPGWLRQIVRTQANRLLRKRREVCLEDETRLQQGGSPMSEPERNDLREYVREVIRGLPPVIRDTTELFYHEGAALLLPLSGGIDQFLIGLPHRVPPVGLHVGAQVEDVLPAAGRPAHPALT